MCSPYGCDGVPLFCFQIARSDTGAHCALLLSVMHTVRKTVEAAHHRIEAGNQKYKYHINYSNENGVHLKCTEGNLNRTRECREGDIFQRGRKIKHVEIVDRIYACEGVDENSRGVARKEIDGENTEGTGQVTALQTGEYAKGDGEDGHEHNKGVLINVVKGEEVHCANIECGKENCNDSTDDIGKIAEAEHTAVTGSYREEVEECRDGAKLNRHTAKKEAAQEDRHGMEHLCKNEEKEKIIFILCTTVTEVEIKDNTFYRNQNNPAEMEGGEGAEIDACIAEKGLGNVGGHHLHKDRGQTDSDVDKLLTVVDLDFMLSLDRHKHGDGKRESDFGDVEKIMKEGGKSDIATEVVSLGAQDVFHRRVDENDGKKRHSTREIGSDITEQTALCKDSHRDYGIADVITPTKEGLKGVCKIQDRFRKIVKQNKTGQAEHTEHNRHNFKSAFHTAFPSMENI